LLADYRNENSSLFLLQRLGEVLIKSISLMSFDLVQESARQAHHKRNQQVTVQPELSKDLISASIDKTGTICLSLYFSTSIIAKHRLLPVHSLLSCNLVK
jgi:hypothetical protein